MPAVKVETCVNHLYLQYSQRDFPICHRSQWQSVRVTEPGVLFNSYPVMVTNFKRVRGEIISIIRWYALWLSETFIAWLCKHYCPIPITWTNASLLLCWIKKRKKNNILILRIGICRGHIVFRFSVCGYVHTNVHPRPPVRVRTYVRTYVWSCLTQIKAFVPGRTWTFKSSYFPNRLTHLVHIWFDDRYRSKVSFSNTHTHAYDLKVKVMKFLMLKTQVKVFVPGRTWTFMIYLVHICYDDRYRLQSDIQQYTRPCLWPQGQGHRLGNF